MVGAVIDQVNIKQISIISDRAGQTYITDRKIQKTRKNVIGLFLLQRSRQISVLSPKIQRRNVNIQKNPVAPPKGPESYIHGKLPADIQRIPLHPKLYLGSTPFGPVKKRNRKRRKIQIKVKSAADE